MEFEHITKTNILLLKCAGLWPDRAYKANLYSLYTAAVILQQWALFYLEGKVLQTAASFEELTEQLLVMAPELLCSFKMCVFIRKFPQLHAVMERLKGPAKSQRHAQIVAAEMELWRKINQVFMLLVFATGAAWLCLPLVRGSGLPLDIICPFNCASGVIYAGMYLHQGVFVASMILAMNVDLLLLAIVIYLGGQCDILCHVLAQLNEAAFKRELVECVKHHRSIVKLTAKSNDFCNVMLLMQFLTTSFMISISLFKTSTRKPDNLQFYCSLILAIATIVQILSYCWMGNRIESKSNNISYAIFKSSWIPQTIAVKRILLLFIRNSQRPIKISAYGLFYLSYETFVKVMRSAWSFLMILEQFHSD